jgi:hypothetical protein
MRRRQADGGHRAGGGNRLAEWRERACRRQEIREKPTI